MPNPAFQAGYPFAFRLYTGNGSTDIFAVPFPYLAQAHVKVYVDNVLQVSGVTFLTGASIQLATPPALNAAVVIRRETPVDPLVTFANAASLKASNLNTDSRQALYIVQEIADVTIGEFLLNVELIEARDLALQAAANAAASEAAAELAQSEAEQAAEDAVEAYQNTLALLEGFSASYDVSFSVPVMPGVNEYIGLHSVVRNLILPEDAPGCVASGPTGGDDPLVISMRKNGVEFGTVTFAATESLGSFSVPDEVSFVPSDEITGFITSASSGSMPEGFSITLKFIRNLI